MKQPPSTLSKFIARWSERGYEKGETQQFWIELLTDVLGIADASSWLTFEQHVPNIGFIDARIPRTKVLIEQKSADKDLLKPAAQSDGSLLTPFLQAKRYADWLPASEHPRWIVCCNFREFLVYDMEQPQADPVSVLLRDLAKEHHRLSFLVKETSTHLERELQISLRAGEIIGEIHDALLLQYQLGGTPRS
ncbi:MAG: methylase, partial [Bacteroidaceae bacterium]|nr:methylase [Bacteroidaceae bacterium]